MSEYANEDLREIAEAVRGRRPHALLAKIRERSPYQALDGLVVVGRYDHCTRILRDPRISCVRERARISRRAEPLSRNFLNMDPPDHTRLRRLVSKAFTPREASRLTPMIQAETDNLLEAACSRGRFDVVTDLASPMPMAVICALMGIPACDWEQLRSWVALLSQQLDLPELRPAGTLPAAAIARARADFIRYLVNLVRARRHRPVDDLISQLIAVQADGDRLTESELIATCILLIDAGHDTSVNLISNGVLALLEHPAQWELLAEHPQHVSAVVEEVLRYDSPVQLVTRVVAEDFDLDGFPLGEGDLVVLLLGGANHDPEAYLRPEVFDPQRHRPANHLSFSGGPHFCLGAGLARLEAAIALGTIATRLVRPRLVPGGLVYKPNVSLRGPEHLPVTVDGLRGRGQQ